MGCKLSFKGWKGKFNEGSHVSDGLNDIILIIYDGFFNETVRETLIE